MKSIKPGSRPPRKRWCEWLSAVPLWTPEQRQAAYEKSLKAWQSGNTQAQYSGLVEMSVLKEVDEGTFQHKNHCAVRH